MRNLLIALLIGVLISCSGKSSDKESTVNLELSEHLSDTSGIIATQQYPEETAVIDQFIKDKAIGDTIVWKYSWKDEYDASWSADVYTSREGEFSSVVVVLNEDDPVQTIRYHFDSNEQLCRIDLTEVRKNYYRDEVYEIYYFHDGVSFWLHKKHFSKNDFIIDTTFIPPPFNEDEFPMYYTKEDVRMIIMNKEPDNL